MTKVVPCRLVAALALAVPLFAAAADAPSGPTLAGVLEASRPSDWRTPDPEHLLYVDVAGGRVVIELAPQFAPRHVANIQTLAREHYWDGLAIVRVQENYVVQWGDPEAGEAGRARSLGKASASLPAEFVRAAGNLPFTRLPDGDVYAPQVGWAHGFPAARSSATGEAWLAHCHGMVGAGRDTAADSSNGSELYVVSGHSPRHLDRNITVVGRVLEGIEVLTALPRGTGAMGFHEAAAQRVAIRSVRLASELPESEQIALQVLRTDTDAFRQLVEARRNRREPWFIESTGSVELCNVPLPVRRVP
jgi:peptidylprolyl isomerase